MEPLQKHLRASGWLSSQRSENLLYRQITVLEEIPIKAINTDQIFHLAVGAAMEYVRLNAKITRHVSLHGLESLTGAHQDPRALKCC